MNAPNTSSSQGVNKKKTKEMRKTAIKNIDTCLKNESVKWNVVRRSNFFQCVLVEATGFCSHTELFSNRTIFL